MKSLFNVACSGRIARSALMVSAVVGTILNLINQGEALLAGTAISWFHLSLNYAVPYCVASYSAAKNELSKRGDE
ncbi:MAG: nitrate/nitrite transporter NrtS [Gammaproteobacteria bacterium]|nr:nitrate/nitrite transporter NrtS [Gammaproteobacteria bacterium]